MKVVDREPAIKAFRVERGQAAKLETGLIVQVPRSSRKGVDVDTANGATSSG
jgi:hypothetical protein